MHGVLSHALSWDTYCEHCKFGKDRHRLTFVVFAREIMANKVELE